MPDEVNGLADYFAYYVVGVVIAVGTGKHHNAEFHVRLVLSCAGWECRFGARGPRRVLVSGIIARSRFRIQPGEPEQSFRSVSTRSTIRRIEDSVVDSEFAFAMRRRLRVEPALKCALLTEIESDRRIATLRRHAVVTPPVLLALLALGSIALQPVELAAKSKTIDYSGTIGRLKVQMRLIESPVMETTNGETYQRGIR